MNIRSNNRPLRVTMNFALHETERPILLYSLYTKVPTCIYYNRRIAFTFYFSKYRKTYMDLHIKKTLLKDHLQQGRQREPNVKTLHSLVAEIKTALCFPEKNNENSLYCEVKIESATVTIAVRCTTSHIIFKFLVLKSFYVCSYNILYFILRPVVVQRHEV